jgi:hypothetical protein
MNMSCCTLLARFGHWPLLSVVFFALPVALSEFDAKKDSGCIDGYWIVRRLETLVECGLPAVAPRVADLCITKGRVVIRVGERNYEGKITFNKDQFYASLDPVKYSVDLTRAYLPNAGVGLYGLIHKSGDSLILDVDEIGDVIHTAPGRGKAPASWRIHLQRKASGCELLYFIRTQVPGPKDIWKSARFHLWESRDWGQE